MPSRLPAGRVLEPGRSGGEGGATLHIEPPGQLCTWVRVLESLCTPVSAALQHGVELLQKLEDGNATSLHVHIPGPRERVDLGGRAGLFAF